MKVVVGCLFGLALTVAAPAIAFQASPARPKNVPDCADQSVQILCRLPIAFTPAQANERLGDGVFAFWFDGDVFNVALKAPAPDRRLSGTIQDWLAPISPYLQGASYRIPERGISVIDMFVRAMPEAGEHRFQGLDAPVMPAATLPFRNGTAKVHELTFPDGGTRQIGLYVPETAAPAGGFPYVIMADGDTYEEYALLIDGLIASGRVEPIVLVGIWPSSSPANAAGVSGRSGEYVLGADEAAFDLHNEFVTSIVLPFARTQAPLSSDPRGAAVFGYSNGADWALAFAVSHPGVARNVIALSASGIGEIQFDRSHLLRLFMQAGMYERPFLGQSLLICSNAVRAGSDCTMSTPYLGHTGSAWRYGASNALERIFASSVGTPTAQP